MKWMMHVASIVEMKTNTFRVVTETGRKGPLGRPSNRWDDDIKFVCKEIG
jgi:hypothetical protein